MCFPDELLKAFNLAYFDSVLKRYFFKISLSPLVLSQDVENSDERRTNLSWTLAMVRKLNKKKFSADIRNFDVKTQLTPKVNCI